MDYETLISHKQRMLKNPTESEVRFLVAFNSPQRRAKYPLEKQFIFWINNHTGFIVDFYIPKIRLAFEVDGSIHDKQREYDIARTAYLKNRQITVRRINNTDTKNKSVLIKFITDSIAKQERLLLLKERHTLNCADPRRCVNLRGRELSTKQATL